MSYPQQQMRQTGEPPLWAPYVGAPFAAAVRRFWKKYTTFSGRASRSEYWWWVLVAGAVSIVLQIITAVGGAAGSTTSAYGTTAPGPGAVIGYILIALWLLVTIVPSLALISRRLHDANFSAWLMLIGLVPFVGGLALLVFMVLPSNPLGQRFDQPGSV